MSESIETTMDALEINSVLTIDDWRAYQSAWAGRLHSQSRLSWRSLLGIVVFAAILAAGLVLLAIHLGRPVPFAAVAVGACAAVLGIVLNMRRIRRAARPNDEGVVLGASRMRFDAQGMHMEKDHSSIRHGWAVFRGVTQTSQHLFVWVDTVAALIVPLRDLPAGLSAQQAIDHINRCAAMTGATAGVFVDDTAPPRVLSAESLQHPSRPAGNFFSAVRRLLILRRVDARAIALTERSIFVLAFGCLGFWLLLDSLTADPGSEFYVYGLVIVGWYASLVLLVAWLWSRLAQPRVAFIRTLAIALTFVPVATALAVLALRYLPDNLALGALILIAVYAALYGNTGLRSITSSGQPRAVFASLLVLSLAAWFGQEQYLTPQFWYANDDAADEQSDDPREPVDRQQIEPLLFQQAERIDAAIDAVDRPASIPSAAFFVGFAGMGEQRVFAEEIALADKVIAQKYGTADRSIRLVNDRRDLTRYPFASLTALRRTLAGLAKRMNVDQDVLFLALSSHGSEQGELAVSNGDIPVNNLAVDELADALRESGIRWRVIVVSACYAGNFIEPLRDDHTIVIAAAAADRTSFGCSDDRDLTYFGEAFYRDALPGAPDLRTAFQRMKVLIAEREKQEDKEPSNPQGFFGTAIERHLRELQNSR